MSGFPTTATLDSLINEVQHNLNGFGQSVDAVTTLTSAVDADDTVLPVDDASSFARGLAEVGEELIFIKSVDTSASTLTVFPWGRGYRGTTASSHAADVQVTMSPVWPRATVAREINNAIRGIYPHLFAVAIHEFEADATEYAYQLPTDVVRVLEVRWRWTGSQKDWERVKHWDVSYSADTTDFPNGKAIHVYTDVLPGSRVQVVYAKRPAILTESDDEFEATTGLSESAKDLVVLGASYRLAPYMDVSRLPVQSVEADELDGPRQLGTAVQIARDFRRQYLERLEEESKALLDRYPAQYRRVR